MSIHLTRLFRVHPFITFTGCWLTRDIDWIKKRIHPNAPAYFIFDTEKAGKERIIEDSANLLHQNPNLLKNLDLPFDIRDDDWDDYKNNIELGFMDTSDGSKDYVNIITNPAFLKKISILSPREIPLFLDCQLEMFKTYPKEESTSNFFLYLEGLMGSFNEPQKVFVEKWIELNKDDPNYTNIPDLPDIFLDKKYFYDIVLQNELVKELYTHDRTTSTYHLQKRKKQDLAGLAIRLRQMNKLKKNDTDIYNMQYLARVFLKFFNSKYSLSDTDKTFQTALNRPFKISQFCFITER